MSFNYFAGPTNVRSNAMLSRATEFMNPDFDINFFEKYKSVCEKIQKVFMTKNEIIILSGEGILGLEAACACLTEDEDNVLVISNGVFGYGFKYFVELYGGNAFLFEAPKDSLFPIKELESFLRKNNNFKYATIVHCDTPSSMLNPVKEICKILKQHGILTVVDAVASLGGIDLNVDECCIDIALCASQKCFSLPPGLTFLSISNDAISSIKNRNSNIKSYYMNLLSFLDAYDKKWFPYTMPSSDINSLDVALDNILNEGLKNVFERHKKISSSLLYALEKNNINSFLPKSCSSPTVTTILLEENITNRDVIEYIKNKYGILISGSFGFLSNKAIRIGHMGENARYERIIPVLCAVEDALSHFYKRELNLVSDFNKKFREEI